MTDSNKPQPLANIMYANKPTQALLYTDTIRGKQVCRDDMWALSTAEINAYVFTLQAIREHWREFGPEHGFDELLETACRPLIGETWPVPGLTPMREHASNVMHADQKAPDRLAALPTADAQWVERAMEMAALMRAASREDSVAIADALRAHLRVSDRKHNPDKYAALHTAGAAGPLGDPDVLDTPAA